MNFFSAFIVAIFYFYGLILFYISFLAKNKGDTGAFINNFTISLVFVASLTINLVLIHLILQPPKSFIVFPFDIFMVLFIAIFLPVFYLLIRREKNKTKKANISTQNQTDKESTEIPLKFDIYRKLSHLVVLGITLFYFTLGYLIQNILINLLGFFPKDVSIVFFSIFSANGFTMIFTQYLVLFLVGISLIGLLTADFVRILKPQYYPLKPVNQILREKELHNRLGPQISMAVGCFSIIILYGLFQPIGPLIICLSMVMSIFGDIGSNLIGRTLGRKKIRNGPKTYEGVFAGIIGAYVSGVLALFLLSTFIKINNLGFYILPLIGSLIIGIIDFADLEIDDNLSYNLSVTTVLFFIARFIF